MKVNFKKCKECKEQFLPQFFNQKFCFKESCREIEIKRILDAQKRTQKKEWSKRKRETKERLKTKGEWKNDLQKEINSIIRLIDKGQSCMMCDTDNPKGFSACHYHSVGSNDTLRFHLLNIWGGGFHCNSAKGGNIIGYDEQLLEKYGHERWELIKFGIKRDTKELHLSIDEIKGFIKVTRSVVKELKKADLIYSLENRWLIRERLNEQIGIYS